MSSGNFRIDRLDGNSQMLRELLIQLGIQPTASVVLNLNPEQQNAVQEGVWIGPSQQQQYCCLSICKKIITVVEDPKKFSVTCKKCNQVMRYCSTLCLIKGKLEHPQVCQGRQ